MDNFTEREIQLIISCLIYKWHSLKDELKSPGLKPLEISNIKKSKLELKELIEKIESY